ncbi:thioredoxin family protein [Chitinophaga barathri]|nr:thioredoxin family protein [Chitinophaga barathri]
MMRSIITLIFFFTCFSTAAMANATPTQGMQFFEGTWAELLQAAQKQGKLIFVDVYTTWCPPCKQMDKEVFPLKEVGDKYNSKFLNYRLNAEKGEGIKLAGQFAVKAYPTYLYLDAQGSLLHRAVGFQSPGALAGHADKILSSGTAGSSISSFENEFKNGKRDPAFLRDYLKQLASLELDNNAVLNAYLEVMPASQLAKPEGLLYLSEYIFSARANALVFVMANYPALSPEQKKTIAARLYSKVLYTAAGPAWKEGRPAEMKQLIAYMDMLAPDLPVQQQDGINKMRILYYGMVKDVARLKETGYKRVGSLMAIPLDSIRREDARLYVQVMKPFLTGEQDSTKTPGFQEEKQYVINQYSRKVAVVLYEGAGAFATSLEPGDPALADALKWAERVKELMPPNPQLDALVEKLRKLAAQP